MHCSTDALLAPGCNPKKKSGPRCLLQLPLVCQQFHSIISKEHVKKGLDLAATSPGSKQHCTWTVSQNMLKPLLISTAHGWILVPTQLHLLTMGLWPQWNLHPTKWHSAPQNTFKFGIAILTSWGLYYGGPIAFSSSVGKVTTKFGMPSGKVANLWNACLKSVAFSATQSIIRSHRLA